jgi:antitoxin component of MazEF toxin-antitoxin module
VSDPATRPTKISQWGNSAAIRLGTAILESAQMQIDDAVDVSVREFEIIIRRAQPRVTMTELLEKFDPEKHRHDLAFDQEPAGTETR